MTRSRKIIGIIEGFKLGSLGAGKQKFVDHPEHPKEDKLKIRIVREDKNDAVMYGKSVEFPSIVWEESDGFAYSLSVGYGSKPDTLVMVLLAGTLINSSGVAAQWMAMSISTPEFDPMIKKYNSYVSEIKTKGIETLVPDGRLLSSFTIQPHYRRGYQEWYKEKEKK